MKIVIEHLRVKRELAGSGFNICGSRKDLAAIAEQIQERLRADDWCYGWVSIRDKEPDEHSAPNTAPVPWRS